MKKIISIILIFIITACMLMACSTEAERVNHASYFFIWW